MSDLKTGSTSYPNSLDSATLVALGDTATPEEFNGPAQAIVAIETELGTGLKGSSNDLATRLAQNTGEDGGLLYGSSFPLSPNPVAHLFWRADLKQLYLYDTALSAYQRIDSPGIHALLANLDADDHAQYVHNSIARTVTAQHTFNPSTAKPPFVLGANAQGQRVVYLNADTVDGSHASAFATLNGAGDVQQNPASKGVANGIATLNSAGLVNEPGQWLSDGTHNIQFKILTTTWNMDTTATISIAHSGTVAKFRAVTAVIANNAADTYCQLPSFYNSAAVQAHVNNVDATNVVLTRTTSGTLDTAAWNNASVTVTIWYLS